MKENSYKLKLQIRLIKAMQKTINENLVKIGKQLSKNQKKQLENE